MPTDKPRVMLTLDEDTYALLKQLADHTDLSVSAVVNRFIGAHMHELSEFLEWFPKQQKGSTQYVLGKNLMQSYGPEGLMGGIRRLDPKHEFAFERFERSIKVKAKR